MTCRSHRQTLSHKSGDPTDPDNYRGISVCSCLGKLFNRLLQKRLDNFLEDNNLLCPSQNGFRKGFRTTDNIFILKTVINKYLNRRNGKVFVCFVDFKKAFDSVWRQALLFKLLDKGIGGSVYKIIKHMYSNTKYSYKSSNFYSNPFMGNSGVKQGDNLSPHSSISLLMTLQNI